MKFYDLTEFKLTERIVFSMLTHTKDIVNVLRRVAKGRNAERKSAHNKLAITLENRRKLILCMHKPNIQPNRFVYAKPPTKNRHWGD